MNPDEPANPPSAPEPETNPVPPPEPQPEAEKPEKPYPSAFNLFKPSWEAIKLNFWTFFVVGIAPIVLGVASLIPAYHRVSDNGFTAGSSGLPALTILIGVLFIIASLFLAPALTYTQLKSAQGQKLEVGEAIKGASHFFWRYYGVAILAGLIIIGGFILLIVPGIYMIKRYYLAAYALMAEDLPVKGALKRSREISSEYSGAVWGVLGVNLLIGIIGIIPLIGQLISFIANIVYYCAPAVRYEQLHKLAPAPVKA